VLATFKGKLFCCRGIDTLNQRLCHSVFFPTFAGENILSVFFFIIQCVSGICQWWFDFKLEPIFDTAPAASKNEACFKSCQS
jgi:hypothetical protein